MISYPSLWALFIHTHHPTNICMLRHGCQRQHMRIGTGRVGVVDEDEANAIVERAGAVFPVEY
jgi:hypothetical protein